MKITIRQGVFETNSSSSHSLSITTLDKYNKWMNGEFYLNAQGNGEANFITIDEMQDLLIKYDITKEKYPDDEEYNNYLEDFCYENNIYTYDSYYDADTMGIPVNLTYTTPAGERIIVFGEVSEF